MLQLASIIVSIMERGKERLLRGRYVSKRQKIGRRKQQSAGIGPRFVDAKFNRLIAELNLYRARQVIIVPGSENGAIL